MGVDVSGANGLEMIVKESDHEARTNLKKAVVRILQFKSGSWTNTMTLPDVDVGLTWLAASGVEGWGHMQQTKLNAICVGDLRTLSNPTELL